MQTAPVTCKSTGKQDIRQGQQFLKTANELVSELHSELMGNCGDWMLGVTSTPCCTTRITLHGRQKRISVDR
jgi:hypothetical protein